jgi:hypothetical protein
MGAPNATATPAALAAVTISRILPVYNELGVGRVTRDAPWLRLNLPNKPATSEPMQHATCTDGPSLPTDSPDAITSGCTRTK